MVQDHIMLEPYCPRELAVRNELQRRKEIRSSEYELARKSMLEYSDSPRRRDFDTPTFFWHFSICEIYEASQESLIEGSYVPGGREQSGHIFLDKSTLDAIRATEYLKGAWSRLY